MTLMEAGDYRGGLSALQRSERELHMVTTGNSFEAKYALWEGFALDHLGQLDEAVPHYLHVFTHTRVMARLLDLYEGAGQLGDLERMVTERSSRSSAAYAEAVPALTLLVMRRVAQAGDWGTLIAILQDSGLSYPWGHEPTDARDVRAAEAFKLLTRSCDL